MALEAGTKLGPYEILSPLGAGGMGEVCKAKDTRLDRTVAIKVLPSHLSDNARLKERFEREARAVSSLNHPHICTLHDIGSENGVDFMVMEHIEGETLADRLKKGALPLDQALRYATEIADALDKAHRQGVVHRDLKPGNIMLTKSGAKLLDFGLAKLTGSQTDAVESALPTQQRSLTAEGSILGTFQYMTPEQLEGKEADSRTDIFAFGAVLYEMVTGRRAFEGKSQASLIHAIMGKQPPTISTVESMSPLMLDHVVTRCLAKEPDERWQTASDMMRELKWIGEAGSDAGVSAAPKPTSGRLSVGTHVAAAFLFGGMVAVAVWSLRPEPARPLIRVVATPPSAEPLDIVTVAPDVDLAITPDGTRIVYVVTLNDQRHLVVRAMDQLEVTPLSGLGNAPRGPFISPDGNWVGYFDGTPALQKVSILGGPPVTICELPERRPARGASWGPDDTIIFANSAPADSCASRPVAASWRS